MSERGRIAAFAGAASVVLVAWLLLTVAASETSRAPRAAATTASTESAPPAPAGVVPSGAKATVIPARGAAPAAPVPPAALAVARRYAREWAREHAGRRARVVAVTGTDDPATGALELTAAIRGGGRRSKVVLSLQATGGHWWVVKAR